MISLIWTKEKPNKKGYYWHRHSFGQSRYDIYWAFPYHDNFMIDRQHDEDGILVTSVEFNNSDWCGPLLEPEENKENTDNVI